MTLETQHVEIDVSVDLGKGAHAATRARPVVPGDKVVRGKVARDGVAAERGPKIKPPARQRGEERVPNLVNVDPSRGRADCVNDLIVAYLADGIEHDPGVLGIRKIGGRNGRRLPPSLARPERLKQYPYSAAAVVCHHGRRYPVTLGCHATLALTRGLEPPFSYPLISHSRTLAQARNLDSRPAVGALAHAITYRRPH
jgi:hypothetical protein